MCVDKSGDINVVGVRTLEGKLDLLYLSSSLIPQYTTEIIKSCACDLRRVPRSNRSRRVFEHDVRSAPSRNLRWYRTYSKAA